MSRGRTKPDGKRDAIGAKWFYKYGTTDCYNFDEIVIRKNFKCKPPKYYDSLLDLTNSELLGKLKRERKLKADNEHNKGHRLYQRGRCAFSKMKAKKRGGV